MITKDLDDELNQLLLYKEEKHTGYVGFTKHGQTFKELFGKQVEIKHPTIEELMIYLEKMKETNDVETQNRNGLMTWKQLIIRNFKLRRWTLIIYLVLIVINPIYTLFFKNKLWFRCIYSTCHYINDYKHFRFRTII